MVLLQKKKKTTVVIITFRTFFLWVTFAHALAAHSALQRPFRGQRCCTLRSIPVSVPDKRVSLWNPLPTHPSVLFAPLNRRWVIFYALKPREGYERGTVAVTRRIRARICGCGDLSLMTGFLFRNCLLYQFTKFSSFFILTVCAQWITQYRHPSQVASIDEGAVYGRVCSILFSSHRHQESFPAYVPVWSCEWSASTQQFLTLRRSWKVSVRRRKDAFQLRYCLPAVVEITASWFLFCRVSLHNVTWEGNGRTSTSYLLLSFDARFYWFSLLIVPVVSS